MDFSYSDKKEVEVEYIKTILLAIAKELRSQNYPREYLNQKTKLAKIICIVADELGLPITMSWYRHGQYPFIQDLDIDLYRLILGFYNNIDKIFRQSSESVKDIYRKVLVIFKKINITELMRKNHYIFLEQYYNDPKFNKNKYINLYRRYFQLCNFLNNEFELNLKTLLEGARKVDYKKFITEEYDITEEEPLFKEYKSQASRVRVFFNNFLYELNNQKYDFPEEVEEDVYNLFNVFEKVCLKTDLIFSMEKYDQKIIGNYGLINKKMMFFWETLASFISTKEHKGPRVKDLIMYYTKQFNRHIKSIPSKTEELKEQVTSLGLDINKKEFDKIKTEDKKIKGLIHEFALRA